MTLGRYVLGVGSIATGIVDLVWRNFDPSEEPIQAFGDRIPGREVFACAVAVVLIAAGIAIWFPRTARAGAVLLGAASLLFAIFWLPRLYWTAVLIGWWGPIGVLGGIGQQVIIIVAAAIVYDATVRPTAPSSGVEKRGRWVFGTCAILFGLVHVTSVTPVARMVPTYMPFGGNFWAVLTGIAFILAGIAIVSGFPDVLAARLLTCMLVVFSALALPPLIAGFPHSQGAWGANAYNVAAIGAAWVLADRLSRRDAGPAPVTKPRG